MGQLFRGSPRLLVKALPWALGVLAAKLLLEQGMQWHPLELNPLLTGTIGAEVFIVGFLLSGTASDFKEAERLPGELAASLETMADECLILSQETALPEPRACVEHLIEISTSVREWLLHNRGFDHVMDDIRALNAYTIAFTPVIQSGSIGRLKGEQHAIRRVVIRMDTMRRTSYVAAAYMIAEITALAILALLLLTDLGAVAPTVTLVSIVTFLLFYLLYLLRDLDNPFEYIDGHPGAADVALDPLELCEGRLRGALAVPNLHAVEELKA